MIKAYLFFAYIKPSDIEKYEHIAEYLDDPREVTMVEGYYRVLYAWTDSKILRDNFKAHRDMKIFGRNYTTIKFSEDDFMKFALRYISRELESRTISPHDFSLQSNNNGVGMVVGTPAEFDWSEFSCIEYEFIKFLDTHLDIPITGIFSEKYVKALNTIGYLFDSDLAITEFFTTTDQLYELVEPNQYNIFYQSFQHLYKKGGLEVESL